MALAPTKVAVPSQRMAILVGTCQSSSVEKLREATTATSVIALELTASHVVNHAMEGMAMVSPGATQAVEAMQAAARARAAARRPGPPREPGPQRGSQAAARKSKRGGSPCKMAGARAARRGHLSGTQGARA